MWDTNDENSIPKFRLSKNPDCKLPIEGNIIGYTSEEIEHKTLNIKVEGKEYWVDYETYQKEIKFMSDNSIPESAKPYESNIIEIIGRYITVPNKTMFEDELPEMTSEEYSKWFETSYVDIVRIGKYIILNDVK